MRKKSEPVRFRYCKCGRVAQVGKKCLHCGAVGVSESLSKALDTLLKYSKPQF